jgi:hypothetical protein
MWGQAHQLWQMLQTGLWSHRLRLHPHAHFRCSPSVENPFFGQMSYAGNQPRGDAGAEAAADLAGDDDRGRLDLAKVRGLSGNTRTS